MTKQAKMEDLLLELLKEGGERRNGKGEDKVRGEDTRRKELILGKGRNDLRISYPAFHAVR